MLWIRRLDVRQPLPNGAQDDLRASALSRVKILRKPDAQVSVPDMDNGSDSRDRFQRVDRRLGERRNARADDVLAQRRAARVPNGRKAFEPAAPVAVKPNARH